MTNEQSEILSKLIDTKWESKHETNPVKKFNLILEVNKLENQLRESMGREAYNDFMDRGRKMFAPKA